MLRTTLITETQLQNGTHAGVTSALVLLCDTYSSGGIHRRYNYLPRRRNAIYHWTFELERKSTVFCSKTYPQNCSHSLIFTTKYLFTTSVCRNDIWVFNNYIYLFNVVCKCNTKRSLMSKSFYITVLLLRLNKW